MKTKFKTGITVPEPLNCVSRNTKSKFLAFTRAKIKGMWNFGPMPLPIFTMWCSDTESIFFVYPVQRNTHLMWHISQTVMYTKTMILWNPTQRCLGFIQTCCSHLQSRIPTFFNCISYTVAIVLSHYEWHAADTSSDISPI